MQKIAATLSARAAWFYLYCVGISSKIVWIDLEKRTALEKKEKNFIYAFWHGRQFFFPWAYRNLGVSTLVSKSKDGEIIAKVIHYFGLGTVRGSSSRGAARALIELIHAVKKGNTIAFTPDGPRGPQKKVAPGILYVAQKTSKPILPITYSAKRKIIIKGWDNYWIPLPFNTITIRYGNPLVMSSKDDIQQKAFELESELNRITQACDRICLVSFKETVYFWIYNMFLWILFPFFLFLFLLKQPKRFFSQLMVGIPARVGNIKITPNFKAPLWIHAASLGECKAAFPFVKLLRKEHPNEKILFTANTLTGINEAKKLNLGDIILFAPLDYPFALKRFFKAVHPKALILVESEIWPNRLQMASELGIKVILINGRISQRSKEAYLLLRSFSRLLMNKIDGLCVREQEDFNRFVSLGISQEKIHITGNLKLDYFYFQQSRKDSRNLERSPFLPTDLVWTAASIRSGEEKIIIATYQTLLKDFPNLKLILAPRHLEEIEKIQDLLKEYKLTPSLRSSLTNSNFFNAKVILWNSYGDLDLAFLWSNLVFMGGSLVPIGGHNPIEPATFGKPILFGPHMENFKEVARLLIQSGGSIEVEGESSLLHSISKLLQNPETLLKMGSCAKEALQKELGQATVKSLKFCEPILFS